MTLKVIGAGFGRTGTDSMREALTILGFGPCHHMFEVMAHEEQKRLWRAVAQGAEPDWTAVFAGYASCVDWPSAYFWRELMAYYPDAKVILTWRTPESWWTSFESTVLKFIGKDSDQDSVGVALIAMRVFDGRPHDRDNAIGAYEANVKAVKESVPPERLLVHRLGDGWAPLCSLLGVPNPELPYPSRNSAGEFQVSNPKA